MKSSRIIFSTACILFTDGLPPGYRRDAYRDAIDKVRSQHEDSVKPSHSTVECPKCGTRQVITDAPGMRRCLKCGYEFRQRA